MIVVGLTGGIASGKSSVAAWAQAHGIATFDADNAVHQLLSDPAVIARIAAAFSDITPTPAIDRQTLSAIVFADSARLLQLEQILHPLIRAREEAFIASARAQGARAAMLEIPLLFETGAERLCDVVIATSAPKALRKQRAFLRPHMTEKKWQHITRRQMAQAERNRRADFVLDTSKEPKKTEKTLIAILKNIGAIP